MKFFHVWSSQRLHAIRAFIKILILKSSLSLSVLFLKILNAKLTAKLRFSKRKSSLLFKSAHSCSLFFCGVVLLQKEGLHIQPVPHPISHRFLILSPTSSVQSGRVLLEPASDACRIHIPL